MKGTGAPVPQQGHSPLYFQERLAFDRLRSHCKNDVRHAYEVAIHTLLNQYNATVFENRFVVGGAVGVFTCGLLRSVGVPCTLRGDRAVDGDIMLGSGQVLSLKSSFGEKVRFRDGEYVGVRSLRVLNQMRKGRRPWETATLFVVSGIGIVFGTPAMVRENCLRQTANGLELTSAGLCSILANPENVFEMSIAAKPPTRLVGSARAASTLVAHDVLTQSEECSVLYEQVKSGEQ